MNGASMMAGMGWPGVLMMLLASGMMYFTRKLNREVTYDVKTAVGRNARIARVRSVINASWSAAARAPST